MARKKVKLAYIIKNSMRKSTFKKRKDGLIKMVNEISTLCGVDACVIIYNQNDSQPEVWPSESETQRVLHRFQTMPKQVQEKNMLDQEGYLKQRILKAQELLRKQKEVNRKELENFMKEFMLTGKIVGNANLTDPNDLLSLIDENLKGVEDRIKSMQSEEEVRNIGANSMNVVGAQTNMGDIQGMVMERDNMNMNMNMDMDNVQGMMMGEEQVNMSDNTQGLVSGGELEAYTSCAQGLETNMGLDSNMDDMQVDQGWSTDFTNDIDDLLPFGDDDFPNAFWLNNNPHFP